LKAAFRDLSDIMHERGPDSSPSSPESGLYISRSKSVLENAALDAWHGGVSIDMSQMKRTLQVNENGLDYHVEAG
jgi:hypothetical protein